MTADAEANERRNPYLILGVPFGVTSDRATKAFARASRAARQGTSPHTTEDLTWALHQVEHAAQSPDALLDHFRVPADPTVYLDGVEESLVPAPQPYPRRTQPGQSFPEVLHRVIVDRVIWSFLDPDLDENGSWVPAAPAP